jgi:hypothetical protein
MLLQFYPQQPAAERIIQSGKAKSNKHIIHISIPLKEEVQLCIRENAWKPGRMKPPTTTNEEEAKTQVCIWHFVAPGLWKQ